MLGSSPLVGPSSRTRGPCSAGRTAGGPAQRSARLSGRRPARPLPCVAASRRSSRPACGRRRRACSAARRPTARGRPHRRRCCRPRWSNGRRRGVRRMLRRRSASVSFAGHPRTPTGCRSASRSHPGGPSARGRSGTRGGSVDRAWLSASSVATGRAAPRGSATRPASSWPWLPSRRPFRAQTTRLWQSTLDKRTALLSLERGNPP